MRFRRGEISVSAKSPGWPSTEWRDGVLNKGFNAGDCYLFTWASSLDGFFSFSFYFKFLFSSKLFTWLVWKIRLPWKTCYNKLHSGFWSPFCCWLQVRRPAAFNAAYSPAFYLHISISAFMAVTGLFSSGHLQRLLVLTILVLLFFPSLGEDSQSPCELH